MSPVDLRCSPRARAQGTGAVGTASAARAHVLVETPLPWPSDLGSTALHQAVAAAAGTGARIHGVVPRGSYTGEIRVVVHVADEPRFRSYRRHARTVDRHEVPDAVRDLLAGAAEEPGTDVLVCGHGARDRCCGSMGTALAQRADLPGATVWRAGHLGGHRFAPTVLVLPSGTVWAWLDDARLAAVVERTLDPAELRGHYRGSTAVAHPAAQLAEAEVFGRVGWSWLDAHRSAEVVAEAVPGLEWEVEVVGAGSVWRGLVREIGRLPQPACGSAEPGTKDDPVLELVELVEERC